MQTIMCCVFDSQDNFLFKKTSKQFQTLWDTSHTCCHQDVCIFVLLNKEEIDETLENIHSGVTCTTQKMFSRFSTSAPRNFCHMNQMRYANLVVATIVHDSLNPAEDSEAAIYRVSFSR